MPRPGSYPARPKVEFDDDGRIVTLLDDFAYIDPQDERWTAPKGAKADGASIPRPLWPLIGGPFEGRYRNASIIHDFYCSKRHKPSKQVHRMFYDAMITSGVAKAKAMLMYAGVYGWGPSWSDMDTHNTLVSYMKREPLIIERDLIMIERGDDFWTTKTRTFKVKVAKTAPKKRVISAPKEPKPRLRRRQRLSDQNVAILQEHLKTNGVDLEDIEFQVDQFFKREFSE